MTTQLSATSDRPKMRKADTVLQIADHVLSEFTLLTRPCIFMWRELINSFNLKLSENSAIWTRDDSIVHGHFKQFGDEVVKLLRREHKLTVIKVNANIRKYFKHTDPPKQDVRCRNADFFRSCIPTPYARTFGIVLFPRESDVDHPLIVNSLERRAKTTANGMETAVASVDNINDLGNLSDPARQSIRSQVRVVVVRAMEDKHPLFPRTIKEVGK